jgi:hypothetical protein
MKERIIGATIDALRSVCHVRFFRTERGYQGRFYCALQAALDMRNILSDELILEMEYQKTGPRHHTQQRPDIILHVPVEVSSAAVHENNVAVWALKRRASVADAKDDFGKLNTMFTSLHYPLGIFINIDSNYHYLSYYQGICRDRILAFAVQLDDGNVSITQASWSDYNLTEVRL